MISCDIYNPTKALRRVYDGMGGKTPTDVGPGETVTSVVLAEHVVSALKQKADADKRRASDAGPTALVVTERERVGDVWDPPDPKREEDLGTVVAQKVAEAFRRELTNLSAPTAQPPKTGK